MTIQDPHFPGGKRSVPLRAVAIAGIIVPLAVLLPAWWGRPGLDALSMLSFLGCAAAPLPFGAWIGESFGDYNEARFIMLVGLVLALIVGLAGYAALFVSGAFANPPETLLVIPLGQLVLVLLTAFAAWTFGRR